MRDAGQVLQGRHDRENLATQGLWLQVPLEDPAVKVAAPALASLLKLLDDMGGSPPRSGVRVSLMFPGSHVRPHGGPHNVRWRVQLPLLVPCYR